MENSNIAWTDHTYNLWIGCTKVSPGCDHCYAEAEWDTRRHRVAWGPHGERSRTKTARDVMVWNRKAKAAGIRHRVFCASLSDVFDNQVPTDWRADLWALIASCPDLDFLLLTKRPQNISKMLPPSWRDGWPNVWLGCTVENREEGVRRIPHLQAVPSRIRFLSCEPLLEAIEPDLHGIDWVICGGESGKDAREMNPDWARGLMDQCDAAGVAFFMKQTGSRHAAWPSVTDKGTDPEQWPADLRIRQYPMCSGAQ